MNDRTVIFLILFALCLMGLSLLGAIADERERRREEHPYRREPAPPSPQSDPSRWSAKAVNAAIEDLLSGLPSKSRRDW